MNRPGLEDPGRYAPGKAPPLLRVENYADIFFRDATDQSPSEPSVHNNKDNRNNRKRSLFQSRDGVAYVANRVGRDFTILEL